MKNSGNGEDQENIRVKKAPKAYDNRDFIHSRAGREIRLLAEYEYPRQHFEKNGINKTIIFFGSARIPSDELYQEEVEFLRAKLKVASDEEKKELQYNIDKLALKKEIPQYYEDAVIIAEHIAEWSHKLPKRKRFYVCTGGGPGIMEAANRGAFNKKAPTVGLNISLPFEQFPNQFISPNLNFEFHYFFMRKFWFVYLAQALIVFPGGFGTMDELFEILTLRQTGKVTKPMPIILYSEKFWKNVVNFEYLADTGMISRSDLDLFRFASTPEEAFDYLKTELEKIHNIE